MFPKRLVCLSIVGAILVGLLTGLEAFAQVKIETPQPAVFIGTQGQRMDGQLLYLDEKEIRYTFKNNKNVYTYVFAKEVRLSTIGLKNDTLTYNADLKRFENINEQAQASARRLKEEADKLAAAKQASAQKADEDRRMEIVIAETHNKLIEESKQGRFLVQFDQWFLRPQSEYHTETHKTPERLVAEREGFLGMGKPTGSFRIEGGKEFNTSVEQRKRYVTAYTYLGNPSERPVEITVTLKFYFKREFMSGGVDFQDKEVAERIVVPPRSLSLIEVSCDSGAKLVGLAGGLGKLLGALEGIDPNSPYYQAISHVQVRSIQPRVR